MSPPVPVHFLLHQCWMERLHQCCQLCGEMSNEAIINNTHHHHQYDQHENQQQRQHEQHPMEEDQRLDDENTQILHTAWEQKNIRRKSQRNNTSIVRLVYSKHSFTKHRREAESLLQQLPFPACFELIETSGCHENNTEGQDEELDMIADLIDAYKLELESAGTQHEHDYHRQKTNELELHMLQLQEQTNMK